MKQMYFGRNGVRKVINEVVHTSNRAFYVFWQDFMGYQHIVKCVEPKIP